MLSLTPQDGGSGPEFISVDDIVVVVSGRRV